MEPEREEAPGRSSPAAGGSEDSKYHKSCSGAAADALWISRTPGNPNDGSHCTRRAAAEISISVWFAHEGAAGRSVEKGCKHSSQMRVETKRRRSKQPLALRKPIIATVRETRPRDLHRLRPLADDEVIGLRLLVNATQRPSVHSSQEHLSVAQSSQRA